MNKLAAELLESKNIFYMKKGNVVIWHIGRCGSTVLSSMLSTPMYTIVERVS